MVTTCGVPGGDEEHFLFEEQKLYPFLFLHLIVRLPTPIIELS
jgi:hypothetical protein